MIRGVYMFPFNFNNNNKSNVNFFDSLFNDNFIENMVGNGDLFFKS